MFVNYFKTSLRHMLKNKVASVISLLGLAMGVTFFLLTALFVENEMAFDRIHANMEHIFRVYQTVTTGQGRTVKTASVPMPLGPAMISEIPEIKRIVRVFEQGGHVQHGTVEADERVLFADPEILQVFSFPLKNGDPTTAISDPHNIVISEDAARKYFGEQNPMGQMISLWMGGRSYDLIISGIARSIPGNSSVRFDFLQSFASLPRYYGWIRSIADSWNASSFGLYVQVSDETARFAIEKKMASLVSRRRHVQNQSILGLQPLKDVHFDMETEGVASKPGNPLYSYVLIFIGTVVLLIACVNYTTLSAALAAGRAKEMRVRTVVGAQRFQLMAHFWMDAGIMSLAAVFVGWGMTQAFLPVFNRLILRDLHFWQMDIFNSVGLLVALTVVMTILSGSYPVIQSCSQRMTQAILRYSKPHARAGKVSRLLIGIQFASSTVLIFSAIVAFRQVEFIHSKNLGYTAADVIVIPIGNVRSNSEVKRFSEAVATMAGVKGIAGVGNSFGQGYSICPVTCAGKEEEVYVYRVEPGFIDLLDIELLAGRAFDKGRTSDVSGGAIVNEAFVRAFGLGDPIGVPVKGYSRSLVNRPVIIGVIKDMNFLSLYETIKPMLLTLDPEWSIDKLLVKADHGNPSIIIDQFRQSWGESVSDVPFSYSFLEDDLAEAYKDEDLWSRIVDYSAGFSVVLSSIGLFGLAALIVAKRTKEIAVRKVLGASVARITRMIMLDFLKAVAWGTILALPLAYSLMQRWLEGFAYHVTIDAFVFLTTVFITVLFAIGGVGYKAIVISHINTAESIKIE